MTNAELMKTHYAAWAALVLAVAVKFPEREAIAMLIQADPTIQPVDALNAVRAHPYYAGRDESAKRTARSADGFYDGPRANIPAPHISSARWKEPTQ